LDVEKFIPSDFPEFEQIMENWSRNMIRCVYTVAEMAALGLELPKDTFTKMLNGGPHLLAPTGSDLIKYKKGDAFAGFHYDFNFLTIHGKSRFPGLYIWLRTGERLPVKIPDGYLLLQTGRQFYMLTDGYMPKGMHEVVYSQQTLDKVNKLKAEG
jgi:isopenicillin N synthase-like dioxygenase